MCKHLLRKDNRGFSMVELLMLVAIFGVMAGLSIPILNSTLRDMRVIGDARNIATGLTYAKLSAVSQMTHYRVSFDLANDQWSTAKLDRPSGNYEIQGAVNWIHNAGDSQENNFKSTSSSAPTGFASSSSTTVTFNSRGIPIEGPSVVYLSNSGGNYAVTVSISGKVQFQRLTQGQWVAQ